MLGISSTPPIEDKETYPFKNDPVGEFKKDETAKRITSSSDLSGLDSTKGDKFYKKIFSSEKKGIDLTIIALVLFLLAGGFAAYTYLFSDSGNSLKSPLSKITSKFGSTPAEEKLLENPITGELVKESEAVEWYDSRPLAVMVNNHVDARPQSGLIYSDIVYEMVAEGGITRFIAFFLSNTPEKFGPIRSTREYYLVLVKELGDAMLMHEGYSPQALEAIQSWPVRSLQRGGVADINWRDNPRGVATEHTLYSNGKLLRERGNELGWEGTREFEVWNFKDDTKSAASTDICLTGECKPITIDFWFEGDYSAIWDYDRESNTYKRSTGYNLDGEPIPHIDQETKEQITVKNLIIQFADESSIEGDDKNRLEYQLTGSGEGLVFIDGGVQNVTWTKASRDERTLFYTTDGQPVEFNRGKFWISIVPSRNADQVAY